jgi:hypothetical protein
VEGEAPMPRALPDPDPGSGLMGTG